MSVVPLLLHRAGVPDQAPRRFRAGPNGQSGWRVCTWLGASMDDELAECVPDYVHVVVQDAAGTWHATPLAPDA